jgi:hypothetical protein
MKAPKFEKESTFSAPHISDEITLKPNVSSLQLYHRMNSEMTVRIATARSIISTQQTATLPTPLRPRHLMTSLIVYKRTDGTEFIHPNCLLQLPFFSNICRQKNKTQTSSEDISTKFFIRSALFWDITPRHLVIVYRRFGTTYRSHTQGSRVGLLTFEDRTDTFSGAPCMNALHALRFSLKLFLS